MTKSEFLRSTPDIIHHNTWGYGELEIVIDKEGRKGACYRHKDNTASGGNYGKNWMKVHKKITAYLKSGGYIQ